MPNLNFINATLPGALAGTVPEMARVSVAVAISGISRSALYREAARGNIRMRKHGRTTLVDMQSVRDFLASLPPAELGQRA